MAFELSSLLEERQGENFKLHQQYLNPQLAKVLKTIGFDRFYVRGRGRLPLRPGRSAATSTSSPASASSPSAAATRC